MQMQEGMQKEGRERGLEGPRLQGVTLLKSTQDNNASSILQFFPVGQSHSVSMTEGGQGWGRWSGIGHRVGTS